MSGPSPGKLRQGEGTLAADGAAGLESLYAALRYDLSVAMAQIGVETIGQIGSHNLIEETQMMTAHTDASAKAKGKKS